MTKVGEQPAGDVGGDPSTTAEPTPMPDATPLPDPTTGPEPSGTLLFQQSTSEECCRLVAVDLDGGDETVLGGPFTVGGRWSGDDAELVFTRDLGNGQMAIEVQDMATGEVETLTTDAATPTWSPDCQQVAFARFDPDAEPTVSELWVAFTDGRAPVPLGIDAGRSPDWSPDGSHLVFVNDSGGDTEVGMVDLTTGRQTMLTDNAVGDTGPRWSPDGTLIAFASRVNQHKQIFVMEPRPDAVPIQVTTGPRNAEGPVWSPDGAWITYEEAGDSLALIRADGTDRMPLGIDGYPEDWGPKDGRC